MTPWRIGLGYIALSVLALALFAMPLWYGWRANVGMVAALAVVLAFGGALAWLLARHTSAVRHSEERFRRLTALSSDFFWETDTEHRYTAIELGWSYAGVRNNGVKLGLARWEIAYTSPGEAAWAAHRATIAARERFVDFAFSRIEAGDERFYEHSGEPRYDAQGNFLGYRGVGRDVTARKRGEDALIESEKRYERVVQASNSGLWDWDVVRDKYYVSPRFLEMNGFPPDTVFAGREDFVRRNPMHEDDLPKYKQYEQAVRDLFAGTGSRLAMEVRVIINGEVRWRRLEGICFRDAAGKVVRWTGATTDITEQKLAQEALRDSEERYERAMSAAEAGFWDWDVVQDKYYVSPRLLEMAGLPPDTIIAGRADFQARVPLHPEDLAKWQQAIKALFAGGGSRLSTELRVIVGGETRWYRLDGMCFRDSAGKVVRWAGSSIDITARKLAEHALRASEERYSLAMDAAEEGHFDINLETDELFTSERFNEIHGFPRGTRFGTRTAYLKQLRFYGNDAETFRAAAQATLAKDAPERYEFAYRILRPSGEMRWVKMRGKVTRDADGRARRRTGVVADFTERKLAEEALRESEARKSAMFETALDCIISIDDEGRVVEFNPAAERTFGYRRGEALGKELAELIIPPRLRADHRQGLARYLKGGAGPVLGRRTEMPAVRADGSEFPVELAVTRIATESAPLFTAYLRDITERKRSEEALRNSEQRYALAMEAAGDGHTDWDLVSGEHYISPRLLQICGYAPGTAFRDRAEWVRRFPFHPEDRPEWERAIAAHFAGRESQFKMELRIVVRGEVRWTVFHFVSTRDAAGAPIRWTGSIGDITEAKRIEEALRLSESRYAVALEVAEEGHWDWNVQTDEIFASPQARRVLDVPQDAVCRTRGDIMARVRYHPDDAPRIFEEWRAVLAGRVLEHEFQYRVLHGDDPRWIRGRWKVFRDAAGVALRVIGVVSDITDRKEAADTLRESESRFRTLTELSSDAYWTQDENLRFLPTGTKDDLAGYRSDFHVGQTRWELSNAAPLSATWAEHEAVLQARKPFRDFEYRRTAPDGSVRYLSISGAPIFDQQGNFKGYQGTGRNITERKRIEEALRQSEERYALAVAGSNEGIFDWDLVSDRAYVSYRAQELFGLPRGELWRPRRDWRHILTFHPEDVPRLHASNKAHIEGGTPTYDEEFRIVLPDGGVRWFRQRGIALRDASGKAYRMVGSIGDVTEQHKAEGELSKLERQLRQAQRLEAMGTLAGGIAHDFNNILGAILGYGEMALRDAAKGSRLRRDLDSIVVAGERGRALVDRVLAFSRSGVGERVPVHVEKVVREALDLVSAKLPPSVTLHAKLHAGGAAMLGDATQVHQVVMNLATNAVQAMPAGGTLRVHLDALRIDAPRVAAIGRLSAAEYLVLKVADTGAGIAPQIMERIFDPFFTTKEVGTGTGLGLSLVHGIVTELGGAIDVASAVGAGSTFTVYLPRSGDAVDKSEHEETEMPRGDGQRVLVVDDEEPLVQLATRTLKELGYAPVGFTSSAAALAAFRADPQRFDAVITDERMPGMSGSALIRAVRGIRGRIPVVLMSGFVGGTVASAAREAGAEEVLKKPLSARDLAASLARVLHP